MAQGEDLPILNPAVDIDEGYYQQDSSNPRVVMQNAGITGSGCYGANGDTIVYFNPNSTLKSSSGYLGRILRYKTADRSNYQGYSNCKADGTQGTFTTSVNQKYFYINVDIRNLAGSYCYNQTTGKVYYAGKDTPYYGKTNIND